MARFDFFVLVLVVLGGGVTIEKCAADCLNQPFEKLDELPQDQFLTYLTDPCRYDRNVRPNTTTPFEVKVKMDVTHLEAAQAQFTAYVTMQLVYIDNNLNYESLAPTRSIILGGESLLEKIWTPNILIKDQDSTTVVGIDSKDILISIEKTGQVTYSYKMVAQFYCWMDLRKFPFDSQKCKLTFSDWSNNSTNLVLIWNDDSPFSVAKNLHLTEFVIDETQYSTGDNYGPYQGKEITSSSTGNFSELVIQFRFHRDVGYYLLDFFIPSYLLVFTAWVTFWLQADAGPPRATLGASTIVAFITLHLGVSKDIPKVSYIKASDIWFLGVTCFIFLSLAEFAFVNVIWRRKKQVELKKPKQKYILKSAVMPRKAREDLRKYQSQLSIISKSSSKSLNDVKSLDNSFNGNYKNMDSSQESMANGHSSISIPDEEIREFTWTTMTPKEVAIFVDRKARIVFPLAFLVFNIFYWVFVYCV